jgi:predicted amidophosphoribosyltransferase
MADWMDWLEANSVLVPTAPRPDDSCETCQGAVGARDDGQFYDSCYQCGGYNGELDTFVPITYSVASGLESVLHRFKDFGDQYSWMANPLGSLLTTFLSRHRECIEADAGGIDVAAYVPSNNRNRAFNQLDRIVDAVKGSPVRGWFPWDNEVITRDFSETRPGRAEVKPDAYAVDADAVRGRSVLLLDDTWTSGSSLVSSAAALKRAGASYVLGLTIGRQLNESGHYGSTDEILADVRGGRRWTDDDCVLCS